MALAELLVAKLNLDWPKLIFILRDFFSINMDMNFIKYKNEIFRKDFFFLTN